MYDLCLVTVPYSHLHTPSLAVALLTACTKSAGLKTESVDSRFRFAERLGLNRYLALCLSNPVSLLGETTFAPGAFEGLEPDYMASRLALLRENQSLVDLKACFGEDDSITIEALWQAASEFIHEEAQRILDLQPKIVGCSSSSQQSCASLALLRKIKEKAPDVVTMMGGGNCDWPMGEAISRSFPWVDYIFSGEADSVLAPFCRLIMEHNGRVPAESLPAGVFCRWRPPLLAEQRTTHSPVSLDELPYPDFSGYFRALSESGVGANVYPALQLESARGCWWRQKTEGCTFCGQNGQRTSFRHKAPDRLRAELTAVQDRYLGRAFVTVMSDTVMPREYLTSLLDDFQPGHTIYWMTDAALDERQLSQLAAANVRAILPGLESFHDGILRLLNKPNTAIGNVAFLKYARENGMWVVWHFLCGVPGEKAEWYDEMAEWIPCIRHLPPPVGTPRVRFDRFSAYHRDPSKYGLQLVPNPMYRWVYPIEDQELADLAYYFVDANDSVALPARVTALRDIMREWQQDFERYSLSYREEGGRIHISDTRPCANESSTTLNDVLSAIYRACRAPRTRAGLLSEIAEKGFSSRDIEEAIGELCQRKLLLHLNDKLLALALKEPLQPLLKKKQILWGYNVGGRLFL